MNWPLKLAVALAGALLVTHGACSKRDEVIIVADDDSEMAAAIAKARDTLPQFWQVFDKPKRGESDFP